jgi:hypothetical protein
MWKTKEKAIFLCKLYGYYFLGAFIIMLLSTIKSTISAILRLFHPHRRVA